MLVLEEPKAVSYIIKEHYGISFTILDRQCDNQNRSSKCFLLGVNN